MDSENVIKVQLSLLKTDLCKWGLGLLPRGAALDAFSLPLWERHRYPRDIDGLKIEISAIPTKKKKTFKVLYTYRTPAHFKVYKCDFTC